MFLRRPDRLLVAGLCLLLGTGASARAWDIFKCHDTKKVKLPPQTIELSLSQPSVTVRERLAPRAAVAPVVGTLYMPIATPLVGFGLPTVTAPASREMDWEPSALSRAQFEADRAYVNYEKTRAGLRAEIETSSRTLSRMGPATSETREGTKACDTAVEQRLKEVTERLDRLNERLTAVERLLIIHDNYLRQQPDSTRGLQREVPKEREREMLPPPKTDMPPISPIPPIPLTPTDPYPSAKEGAK